MEVGFGNARFLMNAAKQRSDLPIIGLEISNFALERALKNANIQSLTNIQLVRSRAFVFFWLACQRTVIGDVTINFPDPWPKSAHQHRRLVDKEFLGLLADRMTTGSILSIATDDVAYATDISVNLASSIYFENLADAPWQNEPAHRLYSKYEHRAQRQGRDCYYFNWRRNSQISTIEIARLKELKMPHAEVFSPMTLRQIEGRFRPALYSSATATVRFMDIFLSSSRDLAIVETFIIEEALEQRLMLNIKGKGKGRFQISIRETGFPRSTPASHYAVRCLMELLISMHQDAKSGTHNLKKQPSR